MHLDDFSKNNIIMFLASSLGSFFNLLYQLVMLRLVSKDVFASLNSLLSLLTIICVPSIAFTIMVAKHISATNARNETLELKAIWQELAKHAFLFSLGMFLLMVIFSRVLAGFLNLGSSAGIIIIGAVFFLSGLTTVVNGGLQGLEKFRWLAAVLASAAFLKVAISYFLVKRIPQLEMALLGFLLSVLAGILLGLWPISFLFKGRQAHKVNLKKLYFYILPTLAATLCFALLTNLDMLLVKHFFLKGAGDYALAQMVGKIILFIPGVIYIVMFSRVSNLHALKKESKDILRRSLFLTFFLSLSAVILFNLFPQQALKSLSPDFSPQAIPLARAFSFSMFFLALSNVLFYYQLCVEQYRFILISALISAFLFIFLWFLHYSPLGVISTILLGSIVIFIVNLNLVFRLA